MCLGAPPSRGRMQLSFIALPQQNTIVRRNKRTRVPCPVSLVPCTVSNGSRIQEDSKKRGAITVLRKYRFTVFNVSRSLVVRRSFLFFRSYHKMIDPTADEPHELPIATRHLARQPWDSGGTVLPSCLPSISDSAQEHQQPRAASSSHDEE